MEWWLAEIREAFWDIGAGLAGVWHLWKVLFLPLLGIFIVARIANRWRRR